jgi:signal transduction histidine kinase
MILLAMEDTTQTVEVAEAMIQLNEELEERIAERTAELNELNHELAIEIVECWRLERQLARAAEAERQRMGHEMHDVLGQQVTAIGILVENLYQRLRAESSEHTEFVARLREAVQKAKTDLRALNGGMFPVDVHPEGLCRALEDLAKRTSEIYRLQCTFEVSDAVLVEDNYQATHLYWIASEAVHNAAVHARSSHIAIRLKNHHGLRLTVRDDGVGLPNDPNGQDDPAGMGLRIMRHRARLVGGGFRVESPAEGGTLIVCSLPTAAQPTGSATGESNRR